MDSMLSQMLGGVTLMWPNVALMAAIFAAIIFRPERIAHPGNLKLACLIFSASLVVPVAFALLMPSLVSASPTDRSSSVNAMMFANRLASVFQALFFGVSFLLVVSAMMPRPSHPSEKN